MSQPYTSQPIGFLPPDSYPPPPNYNQPGYPQPPPSYDASGKQPSGPFHPYPMPHTYPPVYPPVSSAGFPNDGNFFFIQLVQLFIHNINSIDQCI